MATVVLARHGVTAATGKRAGGRTDAPLTEEGRAQAAALAERLTARHVSAVYTSPIARAVETAGIIADAAGREPHVLDGLVELDHGRWTDRPLRQMARTKHFEHVVRTPGRVALPDGEWFVTAQGRAVSAVERVVADHREDATLVLVSHADVIKLLVAHYAGIPIDLFQRLVVSPGSISRLQLPKRGQPRLLTFNEVVRLATGGGT